MKKKFIPIFLFAILLLFACKEKTDKIKNTTPRFISGNYNLYSDGFIFGMETTMFLDFDTMEKTPLCAVPNCTHKTDECLAKIVGDTVVIYNNYAYYFNTDSGIKETTEGREFFIDTTLMKADVNTSETESVSHFTDCAPAIREGYFLVGNELYFIGDNLDPHDDGYGNISSSNVGGIHYLCSVNLDTGVYTNYGSIYDGDKKYDAASNTSSSRLTGFFNNKMYIEYSFCKEMPTIETLEAITSEPYKWFTTLVFEFDTVTKELIESDLLSSAYVDEDTYVYGDPFNNTTTVINKEKKYIIEGVAADVYARVYNNKLFLTESWYDLSDLSKHSLGAYSECEVVSYYDDCYIIMNGGRFIKLTEEELLAL